MPTKRRCIFCRRWFIPSKYRKSQLYCTRKACQRARHILKAKIWRRNHPDYESRSYRKQQKRESNKRNSERNRIYRSKHPERVKEDNLRRLASYYRKRYSSESRTAAHKVSKNKKSNLRNGSLGKTNGNLSMLPAGVSVKYLINQTNKDGEIENKFTYIRNMSGIANSLIRQQNGKKF